MSLREVFEKLHPVPRGIYWSDLCDEYTAEHYEDDDLAEKINAGWNYFQFGAAHARDVALEDAADWVESRGEIGYAADIRAMKAKP